MYYVISVDNSNKILIENIFRNKTLPTNTLLKNFMKCPYIFFYIISSTND